MPGISGVGVALGVEVAVSVWVGVGVGVGVCAWLFLCVVSVADLAARFIGLQAESRNNATIVRMSVFCKALHFFIM